MIYTFYSYKGGVGRSMALANVAKWFYLRGLRVVMIDWDLEAPGLENFFYYSEEDLEIVRSQLGLIDMLMAYKRLFSRLSMPSSKEEILFGTKAMGGNDAKSALAILQESLPPISDMLYPIHPPKPSEDGKGPALWLLSAGWRSKDRFPLYAQAVQGFDWADFYASFQGEAYFEWMRRQLNSDDFADVVLIDSRTGVTEMGGVCTRQLADVVVSFCVPNLQNLVGVAAMSRSFGRDEITKIRKRGLELVIVPTRVDVSELDSRNLFEKEFRQRLDEFTPPVFKSVHSSFWELAIQYIPKYAYSEKLAIGAPDSAKELEEAYKKLAAHLVMLALGERAIRIRKQFAGELQRTFGNRLPGVFISYVGSDGRSLAKKLRSRLEENSIPLLPDLTDAKDKPDGWRQITGILDQAKFMLLVTTPDALYSDYVRKQWRYARQQGVCVFLVKKREKDLTDLPRWMRSAPLYDMDQEHEALIRQLQSAPQTMRVPFMAPDVPDNFVERPAEFKQLKSYLLDSNLVSQGTINVGLWGPLGSGKSALASAFCNDEDVIAAYTDGILWVTLGVNPNVQAEMTKLYVALTGEARTFLDEEDAAICLTEKLIDKNCLIVINDVWNLKHLQPFLRGGKRCARLITTGDLNIVTSIGAKQVAVGEMTTPEATQVIAAQLKLSSDGLEEFEEFVQRLGRLPLALKLARGALQNRIELGDQPIEALDYLKQALYKHGVIAFDQPDNQSIGRSIAVSLDQLAENERERYIRLAFFPEDADVSLAEVSKLWRLDEFEAEEQIQRLSCVSLLKYDRKKKTVRLNSVIRSYILNQMPDRAGLNTKIEAAFAHFSPKEQEAARRVCTRLVRLAQVEDVGEETRLRIKLKDLGQEVRPVAEKLANAQLVIKGEDNATGEPTVELADDSLVQNWDRMRRWIEEDRDFLLWRQQLQAAIAYWDKNGRDKGALLSGSPLKAAKRWRGDRTDDLNEPEKFYIDESARLVRQRRNKQIAVAAVIVVLIFSVLGITKWQADRRALEAALKEVALKDSAEHIRTGNNLMLRNKFDEAIIEFEKAVGAKLDNPEAYYNLGLAYFEKGDFDLAISEYDKAIGLEPDFAEAYLNRGRAYRRKGDADSAIADYNKAIELKLDTAELAKAYNFRGFAYYRKGDNDKALADCEKAIEIDSKYADARDSLGTIYRAKGEIARAISEYDKAIELNPSYVLAYANRGTAYYLKNDLDLAIADLGRAIQLFVNLDQVNQRRDNYIEALYHRGLAYYKKRSYDLAIADFTSVTQLNGKHVEAYLYRGLAYKNKGDNGKAAVDFQKALELSTDPEQGDFLQVLLEQQAATPRIFVHYNDPNDKSQIEDISQRIAQTMGYAIQSIQQRPEKTSGDVRYYYAEDKENADRIRRAFMLALPNSINAKLRLSYLGKHLGKVARGTIEVWLPSLAAGDESSKSYEQREGQKEKRATAVKKN